MVQIEDFQAARGPLGEGFIGMGTLATRRRKKPRNHSSTATPHYARWKAVHSLNSEFILER